MSASALDRVLDFAADAGWRAEWQKVEPGMWKVTLIGADDEMGGIGVGLQEAAADLIRSRLRKRIKDDEAKASA